MIKHLKALEEKENVTYILKIKTYIRTKDLIEVLFIQSLLLPRADLDIRFCGVSEISLTIERYLVKIGK